jgi:VanZ family protein
VSGSRSARFYFALLALGSATFTLIGSLVPFEFQSRSWSDVTTAFVEAMTHRLRMESKSDVIANVMLGIPLGFALLGALCADRAFTKLRTALYGLAILPGCAAFAAAVEFSQLYTLTRTCSGLDVLAQTLGAAVGMAVWLLSGQWFTDQVRKAASGQGTALRFLVGYVLLLGFIQALPLDLSASPYEAYKKFRDGGVQPIPFGEFRKLSGDAVLDRISTLLKLAGLYLPVGLLAARLPARFWERANYVKVFFSALGLAVFIELAQVLVQSRTTSATEAIIGGSAAFFGWLVGKADRVPNVPHGCMLGVGICALIFWVSFQPFEFGPPKPFDWIPGMPLESGNPLFALEEMLTKLVLFGLVGAVAVSFDFGKPGRAWLAVAALAGLVLSAFIEAMQTRLVGHTPCITDVLLGGMGAFCGAWVTGRIKSSCVGEPGA